MSGEVAVLILAHDNPGHVRRLIAALRGLDLFLHVDGKSPDSVAQAMTADAPDVIWTPRHRAPRRRWGAVEAELSGLRTVLEHSSAEHIVVASGSCYPLVSVEGLAEELAAWRGLSRLELNPIPYDNWSRSSAIADGGRHRVDRRFARVGGQVVLVRGVPIPLGRRQVPDELRLHASSQWKIYARRHAQTLLRVLDDRTDLVRFWSMSYVPQESCVASILASPALVGSVSEELRHDIPWYIDWRGAESGGHPRWLGPDDFEAIRASRARPPLKPGDARSRVAASRRLFARKMGIGSAGLLDLIDRHLRA